MRLKLKNAFIAVFAIVSVLLIRTAVYADGDLPQVQNVRIENNTHLYWDEYVPSDGTTVTDYDVYIEKIYPYDVNYCDTFTAYNGYFALKANLMRRGWPASKYRVKVKAKLWNTDLTQYSEPIEFEYSTPGKLAAPQNVRWDGYTAKCDAIANAKVYVFTLYDLSVGTYPEEISSKNVDVPYFDYSLYTLYASHKYRFSVRAYDHEDGYEDSETVNSVEKYGDCVVSDMTGVYIDANNILHWDEYPGTAYYGVSVGGVYSQNIDNNEFSADLNEVALGKLTGKQTVTLKAYGANAPKSNQWQGTVTFSDKALPYIQSLTPFNLYPGQGKGSITAMIYNAVSCEWHIYDPKTNQEMDLSEMTQSVSDLYKYRINFTVTNEMDGYKAYCIAKNSEGSKKSEEITLDVYKKFSVNINTNGGTGSQNGWYPVLYENTPYTMPECTITPPSGAVFNGWLLDGAVYDEDETFYVTKDSTIYPQWFYPITTQPADINAEKLGWQFNTFVEGTNISSYTWHILDKSGKEVSWNYIAENGYGEVINNSENQRTIYINKIMPALDGYKLYCTVTCNGHNTNSDKATINVTGTEIRYLETEIENLDKICHGKRVGDFKNVILKSAAPCTISDVKVYFRFGNKDVVLDDDDTFEYGDKIKYCIFFTPNDGYTISGYSVKINDELVTGISVADGRRYAETSYMDVPVPEGGIYIDATAERTVTAPVVGNTPSDYLVENGIKYSGEKYSNTITWSPNDDTFGNKIYTATVTLTPKENYYFDGNSVIIINNMVLPAEIDSSGNAVVKIVFSKKGDVDLNYKVNKADAAKLLKYISKTGKLTAEEYTMAFVNDDNIIDILDVIAILNNAS